MTQAELSPDDSSTTGAWIPKTAVPKQTRDFGRFPNVDEWCPGDIVLVRAKEPDTVGRAIAAVQGLGYDPRHARWSHASMYIGDGLSICEASRRGVHVNPLFDYLGAHILRVRRFPDLSADQRWLLAVHAVRHLGKPYGFRTILRIRRRLRGKLGFHHGWGMGARSRYFPRALICSNLITTAYVQCTGFALEDSTVGESTPAFLSQTLELADVEVRWRAIASS